YRKAPPPGSGACCLHTSFQALLREDRAPGNLLLIVQYPVFSALRPPHRNLIDLLLLRLLRQLARTNLVLDRPMRRTRRSLARIQILFHTSPLPDRNRRGSRRLLLETSVQPPQHLPPTKLNAAREVA